MMPYWIQETLAALPVFIWVYGVIGATYALWILPRTDWSHPTRVIMTAFALGPGIVTVSMFIMGSTQTPLLTRPNVFALLTLLTLVGIVGATVKQRRTQTPSPTTNTSRLTAPYMLLIVLIVMAVAVRWIVTAYWPFTAYDALWVYGYEGRLYALAGHIPADIGYYPQFLPLQYTLGQLAYGEISDSAARAVLPLLHIGAILAAYELGKTLHHRKTGVMMAALWTFYPAVGVWARMGDLEIPLAFLVTSSAVFFFQAWHGERPRHYAALAGFVYGFALWTKPTAGAFALGIIFINAVELVRLRANLAAYRPRFMVSLITALASAPIGGAWYLRNLALGHNAVDFPPEYWHTLAERGGGQLLWPLMALALALAYIHRLPDVQGRRRTLGGLTLVLLGVMPSVLARFIPVQETSPILWLYPSLHGLPRLGPLAWTLIVLGLVIIVQNLRPQIRPIRAALVPYSAILWTFASTVPYFIVYFWRYSYHYRLSFPIVPLLMLPIAALLAGTLTQASRHRMGQLAGLSLVVIATLPGMLSPIRDTYAGWDYLWSGELSDDREKRTTGNEALMWMVNGFEIYEQEHGEPPRVMAPGVQRLPFFFPMADITIDEAPTQLDELRGYTYYVDSHPDGTGMYMGTPLDRNQVWAALGRDDIIRKAWWKDDGIFRYEIYELHLERQFEPYTPLATPDGEIVFGGFARFVGYEIVSNIFEIGQIRTLKLFWEVLETPSSDYMTYIHIRNADGEVEMAVDGPVGLTEDGRYYTTQVWEPGERIMDERRFRYTNEDTLPGEDYELVIGLYDLATGERVEVTQDGVPIGDGYTFGEDIIIIPRQGEP